MMTNCKQYDQRKREKKIAKQKERKADGLTSPLKNEDGLTSLRGETPFHTKAESIRGKTFPACLDDIDGAFVGKRFRPKQK